MIHKKNVKSIAMMDFMNFKRFVINVHLNVKHALIPQPIANLVINLVYLNISRRLKIN